MEFRVLKWKISITEVIQPKKKYKKKTIGRPEQIHWVSILQNEERKAAEYPYTLLGIGLTVCIIAISMVLLLQGALSQASTITANTTNSVVIANTITATNNLKIDNVVVSFQSVLLLFLLIMIILLVAQIVGGIYAKRTRQLRNYLLERYTFDEDIKEVIMHITKDIK